MDNSEYLAYVRQNYLTRLAENLPKTVLEKDHWLTAPPIMQEVSRPVCTPERIGIKSDNFFSNSLTLAANIFATFKSVAFLFNVICK